MDTDTQHTGMSEIAKRQRERHDHTDTTPRCSACGRWLPKRESGHNRIVCQCGSPATYWVE